MILNSSINGLIIDMDGVLWHGNQPLPGLSPFFTTLRDLQIPFLLATNNASQTPSQYVNKLDSMGISLHPDEILTSGIATAHYLASVKNPATTKVFVIGESGTRQPLIDLGFTLVETDATDADLVVCGLDKSLSWEKLATAAINIQAGAFFVGTNGDTTLPTERGFLPGNGATLAALTAATGVTPLIIGKPEDHMYRQAMKILGSSPETTIAIGDRLDTDILGAVRTGIHSILVLSGIASREELEQSSIQPTWVMQDIQEITLALSNRE